MGLIYRLYRNIGCRLYSAGRAEYTRRREYQLRQRTVCGEDTRFYELADVANLAGDPKKITLGRNCHINGLLTVYNYSGSIAIGDNCSLGEYSRIVSGKKIEIGNHVMIAHNVNILDNNSHPKDAQERREDFLANYADRMKEYDLHAKEIVIEDDVWIGFNSVILKGVRIGRGAIIGAGSVVSKDVEPWTVNVGNPLKCIQRLDSV